MTRMADCSGTLETRPSALSPTKLHRGFELVTYSEIEYEGDKFPINSEATDSNGSPIEGRANSFMNISAHHSRDKRKTKHMKGKTKKKMLGAREVLVSLEQMESNRPYLFALWFLKDKNNRNSCCAAKTPYLRFKFIQYCFERDNMSINHIFMEEFAQPSTGLPLEFVASALMGNLSPPYSSSLSMPNSKPRCDNFVGDNAYLVESPVSPDNLSYVS
ncbi:unnamed protein product [Fraxinus pennsylvanica]|uniref:Uncharacterized protein n=1 Tax=Fraxinus pennsylvanica TaxID=56036 RepID=A0AAD1ZTM2_9LAMI|nr:unnamed protein product [Fraxinus pennsylvanica]